MFSQLTHVMAVALSLSIAAPAFAAPQEDECDKIYSLDHFMDCEKAKLIAQKEAKTDYDKYIFPLIHEEATKAYAWYAQWFVEKYGELELQTIDDMYIGTETIDAEEIVDEDVDNDDDWEWLRFVIRFLIAAAENSLDIDDIAFNSVYDGTVYSPSNQTSASAVLRLARAPDSNDLTATLWVDQGLVADTSWGFLCPDVAIPAGAFPFGARMTSDWDAEGGITRNIKVPGFGTHSIGADFSLTLLSNYDNLVGGIAIDAPFGCSDTTMTATFTRRPGSGPQP